MKRLKIENKKQWDKLISDIGSGGRLDGVFITDYTNEKHYDGEYTPISYPFIVITDLHYLGSIFDHGDIEVVYPWEILPEMSHSQKAMIHSMLHRSIEECKTFAEAYYRNRRNAIARKNFYLEKGLVDCYKILMNLMKQVKTKEDGKTKD